jgi:hypothetical protein
MDLIIELKITNISDWAIIKPLLQRLKIHFVQKTIQKEIEQSPSFVQTQTETNALLTSLQQQSPAEVWSPYDSHKAAKSLLQMLNNSNQI